MALVKIVKITQDLILRIKSVSQTYAQIPKYFRLMVPAKIVNHIFMQTQQVRFVSQTIALRIKFLKKMAHARFVDHIQDQTHLQDIASLTYALKDR